MNERKFLKECQQHIVVGHLQEFYELYKKFKKTQLNKKEVQEKLGIFFREGKTLIHIGDVIQLTGMSVAWLYNELELK